MRTTTVYYWDAEDDESILEDIHDHEQNGWYVHQITSRPSAKSVGSVTIVKGGLFVVYAKEPS